MAWSLMWHLTWPRAPLRQHHSLTYPRHTSPPSNPPQFRELCGPMDPELARVLRPKSLRAMFGLNKIRNGVHCTDLAEDGSLEVSYFFTILQG